MNTILVTMMEEIDSLVNFLNCLRLAGRSRFPQIGVIIDDGLSGRMGYGLEKLQYDIHRIRLENAFVGTDNRIYAFKG